MARPNGHRFPASTRRQAVQTLQGLLAAGVSDAESREQIAERYNVSPRTARDWLAQAYEGLSEEADDDRGKLLGLALRRRRMVMSRSAKKGDWRTYLAAADSEARLLGLEAPRQMEHHVLVEKAQDLSAAVVDVVREHFADDPEEQAKFVRALRARLGAAISRKAPTVVIVDAEIEEPDDNETLHGLPSGEEGGT